MCEGETGGSSAGTIKVMEGEKERERVIGVGGGRKTKKRSDIKHYGKRDKYIKT